MLLSRETFLLWRLLRRSAFALAVVLPFVANACMIWPGLTAAAIRPGDRPSQLPLLLAVLGAGGTSMPCLGQGFCWIFVTDTATGWVPGGGLSAADAFCQNDRTTNHPLLPVGTYKALIVTDDFARDVNHDWVLHANMPYRTDSNSGVVIGTTLPAGGEILFSSLANPISSVAGSRAWTGGGDGIASATCLNWTSSLNADMGTSGNADTTDSYAFDNTGITTCNASPVSLYCVQQ